MNIAIFGDSFANGESDMSRHLAHTGLTQYLMDDGHFVINFSRQGNSNSGAVEDFNYNLRQNKHIKWDKAIVFQTEVYRDTSPDDYTTSISEMGAVQLKRFYSNLKFYQNIYKTPIYLVGGTADTLSPEVVEECGLKCACQSLVNLCVNGDHLIEEPTTDFVFTAPSDINLTTTENKEYFLKLIEMGDDRYKLMGDNPEYFAPYDNLAHGGDLTYCNKSNPRAMHERDHPNRYAYKKLFNHLKSEGIV